MNDAQIYNQAVAAAWEIVRSAVFNYHYHEDLAQHYACIADWMKFFIPVSIVLSVFLAMWPAPAVEKAPVRRWRVRITNVLAFVLAIVSIVLWVRTPDGKLAEHQVLSKQWLFLKGQAEKLRSDLYDMGPTKQKVPAEMLAKLDLFQTQMNALYQGEMDTKDQYYFDLATVQARQDLYGIDVITHEQAVQEYERRKKKGLIPWRETADGKKPDDKKHSGKLDHPSDRSLLSSFSN